MQNMHCIGLYKRGDVHGFELFASHGLHWIPPQGGNLIVGHLGKCYSIWGHVARLKCDLISHRLRPAVPRRRLSTEPHIQNTRQMGLSEPAFWDRENEVLGGWSMAQFESPGSYFSIPRLIRAEPGEVSPIDCTGGHF